MNQSHALGVTTEVLRRDGKGAILGFFERHQYQHVDVLRGS